MIQDVLGPGTIAATLRIATPILLVALGCAVCLKAGVFNIAVEGMMLIAALAAVLLATYFHNALIGLFLASVITILVALLFAIVTVSFRADYIIAGLGLNLLALGLTAWFLDSVLISPGGFRDPSTPALPALDLLELANVPFLGEVLAGQTFLAFGAWGIALAAYFLVHRTKYGLRLRATGEHPVAATTVGINTVYWQYLAILLCGVLCGLAGSSLSLSNLRLFTKEMTAGRGFIAFAAASFAMGDIPGTALVSLLFAFLGSLAIRLEGFGIPSRIVQMIPYLVTVGALILARRRRI